MIDKNNNITATIYKYIFSHKSEQVLIAPDSLNYSVADRSGKIIVPMKFTKIDSLRNGDIKAQKKERRLLFSSKGEFLSEEIDDEVCKIADIISKQARLS